MKNLIKTSMMVAGILSAHSAIAEKDVRLIVTKKDDTSAILNNLDLKGAGKTLPTISNAIRVPESEVALKIAELKSNPDVIAVERDVTVYQIGKQKSTVSQYSYSVTQQSATGDNAPNDPAFDYQAYFMPNGEDFLTGSDILSVWEMGPQVSRPKIAIMDGGFLEEGRFADIQPVMNYSFVDRDGSSYGDSAYNDEEELDCENGHGAGVYGVVGSVINNGEGNAGIVNADMYMLQVMRCSEGSLYDSANALRWAAGGVIPGLPTLEEPVDIANFSLGSRSSCPQFMQAAIDYAVSKGVKVFMGAGNDDDTAAGFTPANCIGNVVTGGLDRDTGDKADFSNYGDGIDIMTQGTDIGSLATFANGFGIWSGTSFAGPITVGTYGLAKAYAPSVDNAILDKLMLMTVTSFTNTQICDEVGCGPGILNAKNFVDAAVRFENGSFAIVTSALSETALCDATPYLMASGVKARLCNAYNVEIDADMFPVEESSIVTYRLYQWPEGESFDFNGSTVVYEGIETEYMVTDLEPYMETGLLRCVNGTCDTSTILPVSLENAGRPDACNE